MADQDAKQAEAVEKNEQDWELAEATPPEGRARSNKYHEILRAFQKMPKKCVEVRSDANPSTMFQQLSKVIRNDEAKEFEGIRVMRRQGTVYLEKVEKAA
jgi:hypothetical protein